MVTPVQLPFYAKAALIIVGLYALISMLFVAQGIILPVIFAVLFAILLSPLVNFLVRKKINRALAVAIVVLLSILFVVALIMLLASQATMLKDALPQLTAKFRDMLGHTVTWASGYFNISQQKVSTWLSETKNDLIPESGAAIGSTLSTLGSVLAVVFLTPVYIFMLLFYQPHLVEFIHQIFGAGNNSKVSEILTAIKKIIQSYLVGLFAEVGIIATLNSIGLYILGIDYALLLGIAGALLNIIPYLGGLIAMGIFMTVALLTKTPVYVLYVGGLYTLIQLIDNNYIVPKIVGSRVKLNAFVSILVVIAGAALWGIPGMFLSIPLTAILKLIFDRIDSLKPLGFLLGDTMPPLVKLKLNFKDISKSFQGILPTFNRK
ncbi:MAG: AI-2E family transporter [Flavobacteriales bacterium]|nr:AI-2E family transporter [Flavobacteriales bacterium]